jgi:hypothetical protein
VFSVAESIEVDLDARQRKLLVSGVAQWGGPVQCTDESARLVGFSDIDGLHRGLRRIGDALKADEPMSTVDWRRALVATEIAFGSDVYGCGVEWQTVTGLSDAETAPRLRTIQRKLARIL